MFKIIGVGSRPGWIRNFFLDPKVVVAWIRIRNKSGFRIRNKSGFTTLLETPQRMEPKVLFLFLLLQLLLLVSIRVGTEIFMYLQQFLVFWKVFKFCVSRIFIWFRKFGKTKFRVSQWLFKPKIYYLYFIFSTTKYNTVDTYRRLLYSMQLLKTFFCYGR